MNRRHLYVLAAIVVSMAPLRMALPPPQASVPLLEALLLQTEVPNLVSGVILKTRLYDTVAEVVVFTLASMGIHWMLSHERPRPLVRGLEDPAVLVLCQLGATVAALVAVELALRGHLSPGGGFAAGVAGGTALGLLLISGSRPQPLVPAKDSYPSSVWTERAEKLSVLGFIVLAFLALEGISLPAGAYGGVESGGWIPVLNVLMALKVTLGSWTMVQLFVRYRGLL